MKNKIVSILVCILAVIGCSFTIVASTNLEKQISVTQFNNDKQVGNTLVTDFYISRVVEVNIDGSIVWQKTDLNEPIDAERLTNGNTLIVERGSSRVIEVDSNGNMIWSYTALNGPYDAERLENGNTLITDSGGSRVIEVNTGGNIIWEKTGLNEPFDAERLTNGNTLIAESGINQRVIEVDSSGTIVWEISVDDPIDVERLENGNTLITEFSSGRIIEVDNTGSTVWEYSGGLGNKFDAERLSDGNTLLTDLYNYRVIEVDNSGTIVLEIDGFDYPVDVERISNKQPNAPTIDGNNRGKPNTEYDFTFNSIDPDGDDIAEYIINWGDGTGEETISGPFESGEEATASHSWTAEETFTIKAKAKDINAAESNWSEFEITIPRTKTTSHLLFEWFLERLPILERLLMLIRTI